MRTALALVVLNGLLLVAGFAQDQAAIAAAESACGPKEVKFDVKEDSAQHPTPQADSDKALLYVVQDLGQCSACTGHGGSGFLFSDVHHALTRIGMDGAWIGANRGNSYSFFSVEPGEHHLCINWQSRFGSRSRAFSMNEFHAEAGKTYYFRERVFPGHDDYVFDLDGVNPDQGRYLLAISNYSVSHPTTKK